MHVPGIRRFLYALFLIAVIASLGLAGWSTPAAQPGGKLGSIGISGAAAPGFAGTAGQAATRPAGLNGPIVRPSLYNDTSLPLRDLNPAPADGVAPVNVEAGGLPKFGIVPPGVAAADPVAQTSFGGSNMPAPLKSWRGYTQQDNYNLYNGLGVLPPDSNGDIGPNHYVEQVNNGFMIFDRAGTLLYGPAKNSTLWQGMPVCGVQNNGDPITLYDQLADRWLVSQFAFMTQGATPPYYECIAISATPDPLGPWHRYEFLVNELYFEDYPHLGVWPDAYYMATNEFLSLASFVGAGAFAFDREKMLRGEPASFVYFYLDSTHGGFLPTDLDGKTPPPPGSPNYFVELWDEVTGQLAMFKFKVNWSNPASSSFEGPTYIDVAPFTYSLCTAARQACVPQKDTTQRLEALNDRLMYRLAYRNFGTHESLVVNHTVNADGAGKAGVRWYELRDPNGTPFTHQQGTYAPDGNSRWMGSAAMDGDGNMALAYSASGSSLFPSMRYTGRLAGDPLGQMPQGEATLVPGAGSQRHTSGRWGDYSFLSVDPVDDCTFWFVSETHDVTSAGQANWLTHIGSFRFPSCGQRVQAQPDLQITGLTAAQSRPHEAQLTATLANSGSAAAQNVAVRFLNGTALIADAAPVVSVAPGGTTQVTVSWNTKGLKGDYLVAAVADPAGAIAESNEANNQAQRTVTIKGNKVENGSFEQSSGGSAPDSWSGSKGTGYDTSGAQASDGSGAVSGSGTGAPAAALNPAWTSAPIAVTPGQTYNLAMTVRTQGASSAPSLQVTYLDALGNVLSRATGIATTLSGDNTARQVLGQVTVPAGVSQLRITLGGFSASDPATRGTVWFDDVWLW